MVAGAPTKIRVETKANGTGVVVPAQNITAGNALTVFSVSRDQYNNYVANTAADSWSIINGTDGVTSADITPAGDSKSATFSSTDTGTGKIQAVKSGRTPYRLRHHYRKSGRAKRACHQHPTIGYGYRRAKFCAATGY